MTTDPGPQACDTTPTDWPDYRPYPGRVTGVRRLSPSFVRVTVSGPDYCWFGADGLDQRIKVVLPLPGLGTDAGPGFGDFGQESPAVLAQGTWYEAWRRLPDGTRNPIRTYTVRRARPQESAVDVDMVLHADAGPAGTWAAAARPGDEIVLVGPDSRSSGSGGGIDFHPGTADRLLLVGDETALPAIAAILESPAARRARSVDVLVEAPHAEDRIVVDEALAAGPLSARVSWASRDSWAPPRGPDGGPTFGATLLPRVQSWARARQQADVLAGARVAPDVQQALEDVDIDTDLLWDAPEGPRSADGGFYAWMAGEAGAIKGLRRFLVRDCGIDRARVSFMGYWRAGRPELD